MERLTFLQGTPEWLAHRATHFNASDAAAMLGVSPHCTRTELLTSMKLGFKDEPDRFQQRRFDEGHEFEALARPLAEKIVGEPLYPIVGKDGKLSASFDGLTMADDIGFEHKRLNEELRACFKAMQDLPVEMHGAALPIYHQVQMEQELLVSRAEKILFMASMWNEDGTLIESFHCWYYPQMALRAKIVAGWAQFERDLATFEPQPEAQRAVAHVVERLPMVLDMRVEGKLVASNLDKYKPAALAYIEKINTALSTDQQFADAKADAKYCREAADKLELAIEQALGQMGDINAAIQVVREVAEAFDKKGLSLEKLVDKREKEIRLEIHQEFTTALAEHVATLNAELGKPYMPAFTGDWAGVMKNQRTIASLRDRCGVELANRKIAADESFRKIKKNLDWLREHAKDHLTLFPDTAQLVLKDHDYLVLEATRRINEQKEAEEARLRREREAEARRMRESEISGIRQQAMIAELGRAGVRKGGTVECIRDTLAETEAWPITEEKFGDLTATAQAAKDKAVADIRALLQKAEAPQIAPVQQPAPAVAPAQPAANASMADTDVRRPDTVVALASRAGKPTLKIGDIQDRLGIPITAVFVENTLGIKPARRENKAVFFLDTDWDRICQALMFHVDRARTAQQQVAA